MVVCCEWRNTVAHQHTKAQGCRVNKQSVLHSDDWQLPRRHCGHICVMIK